MRPNPNVIFVDDEIKIPVKEARTESCATDKRHRINTGNTKNGVEPNYSTCWLILLRPFVFPFSSFRVGQLVEKCLGPFDDKWLALADHR